MKQALKCDCYRFHSPSPFLFVPSVTYKASISCCQRSLSAAMMYTSFHDLHPAFPISFSTVLLCVVLALPRYRHPSDVHINAVIWLLPRHVPNKLSSPPANIVTEYSHSRHLQYFLICNSSLPADIENSTQTLAVKNINLLITFIHLPRLTSIYQDWFYQSLVQPDFCLPPDISCGPDLIS